MARVESSARFSRDTGEYSAPTVAYVFGEAPPEVEAVAACGFNMVAFDSTRGWCTVELLNKARALGLKAVAFPMRYMGNGPRMEE